MSEPLLIARDGGNDIEFFPAMCNRHGLITGATGTGKTVTLQVLAEKFSAIGVPVFLADVKGDLSGIAAPGAISPKMQQRLDMLKLPAPAWNACPVVFWDVFGQRGHPVRATISEIGPLLLGRLLQLNDTQQGVLALTFKVADDNGLLLLDFKDLKAMLQFVGDNAQQFTTDYGNVSSASIGAIQRGLLQLQQQGAESFFGEPALNITDLLQTQSGKGVVNILAADKLMNDSPLLYSTFLLWLMSELYEKLPEVGDPEKPKLVFFFDEAHLLFNDAPAPLVAKIEQVIRLIRSKGVGIFFITQSPLDVPDSVLGQLGNRVQHALRAFTPRDQKAVQVAADTLRQNPKFNAAKAIMELQVGEALISPLDEKGSPSMVQRAFIVPPASQIGPIGDPQRQQIINSSVIKGEYETLVDRESAYEKLKARTTATAGTPASMPGAPSPSSSAPAPQGGGFRGALHDFVFGTTGPRGGHHEGVGESVMKSAARSAGSQMGRTIFRGVLGSIFGGKK